MSGERRYCIVPGCTSSTTRNPEKRFISVPADPGRRKAFMVAIRCSKKYSAKTHLRICEDHFNLEQDAANWVRMKFFPNEKLILKEGVVPHLFQCQPDRTDAQPPKERVTSERRARESSLEGVFSKTTLATSTLVTTSVVESTSTSGTTTVAVSTSARASLNTSFASIKSPFLSSPSRCLNNFEQSESDRDDGQTAFEKSAPRQNVELPWIITPGKETPFPPSPFKRKMSAAEALCQLASSKRLMSFDERDNKFVNQPGQCTKQLNRSTVVPNKVNKGVTVKIKLQCQLQKPSKATATSRFKNLTKDTVRRIKNLGRDTATFPRKQSYHPATGGMPKQLKEAILDASFSAEESVVKSSFSSSICKELDISSSEGGARQRPELVKENHIRLVNCDPMFYIGIPMSYYYLVEKLAEVTRSNVVNVLICLQKIRRNQSFKGLAYDFGVSESYCCRTFAKTIPAIAKCVSKLIFWPCKSDIKSRLPIYFRALYSHVQSIIDCFEVEIEKPSDPVHQTLSWSNYKKCSTLKFLISCTPDGFIDYVSGGFGGRTSDAKITESCGYLDVLPDGVGVMADRGFEGVAATLEKKKCTLVRLPSVLSGKKSSKDEVKLSERIASLRIHIERLIRRLREFNFLKPHACVSHDLCKYTDCVVVIVAGLVNLQEPLIEKYV